MTIIYRVSTGAWANLLVASVGALILGFYVHTSHLPATTKHRAAVSGHYKVPRADAFITVAHPAKPPSRAKMAPPHPDRHGLTLSRSFPSAAPGPGSTRLRPHVSPTRRAKGQALPASEPTTPRQIPAAFASLPSRGAWPNPYHLSAHDVWMIARLVQAEAGDQPFMAQVAVAAVVLNRLRNPAFPKTVTGVLFAPGQFETVSNGSYDNNPSATAMLAARAAAAGWDPTHGALYFYNPSLVSNAWLNSLPRTAILGAQVFAR